MSALDTSEHDGFFTKLVIGIIMPWPALILFIAVIALFTGVQWGVVALVQNNRVLKADVACTMKSFEHSGGGIVMKLDCADSEDSTDKSDFIAAYLNKPAPFTCTRYHYAFANCKLPESKEGKPN